MCRSASATIQAPAARRNTRIVIICFMFLLLNTVRIFRQFHKHHPDSVAGGVCCMSEQWLVVRDTFQDGFDFDLRLVPFEDEHAEIFQHPHAFMDAIVDILPPVFWQSAIFLAHVGVFPHPSKVWRVEHHHAEGLVGERQFCEILQLVGDYLEFAAIA